MGQAKLRLSRGNGVSHVALSSDSRSPYSHIGKVLSLRYGLSQEGDATALRQ